MTFFDVEQGSDEWFAMKKGKFTASTFKDLFAAKTTKAYEKVIYRVVFERLTGESPEGFTNEWMERGKELESEAREKYEMMTFSKVSNGGFVEVNEWIGCSPDGFINDGLGDPKKLLIEIKCPAFNTMINYLLDKKLPKIYEKQVQGQLYVTGAEWCDFMCYHPKLKPLIIRIGRDESMITEIKEKLEESIEKAKSLIKQLL